MPALEVSILVEEDRIKRMTGGVSLAEFFFADGVAKEHSTANAFIVRLYGSTGQLEPLEGYLPVLLWRGHYAVLALAQVGRQARLMSSDAQVIEGTASEYSSVCASVAI